MRWSHSFRRGLSHLICLALLLTGLSLSAQRRADQEGSREQWQKVDEIFAALGVRPGATIADVGAGDGFFTIRLSRAVGPDGRILAVDIDDDALGRLRRRLEEERLHNVAVIKGMPDDPKLPEGTLDGALIVNAYHEMREHQQMLSALHRALKADGRLVIVEPVRDSRRGRPRADQVRNHEIDPEFVLQDARAAGFRVVGLQDPFTIRNVSLEWLMVLQPAEMSASAGNAAAPGAEEPAGDVSDPALRVSVDEFRRLASAGAVAIVDVRDAGSFAAGHIPGALSIPLQSIEGGVEQLRKLGKPIVTYCS
jgi:predicted methyltransferase